jgi:hypothetical protein
MRIPSSTIDDAPEGARPSCAKPHVIPAVSATPPGTRPPPAGGRLSNWPKPSCYLGLTVFTSYFLNSAGTELDIPLGGE